MSKANLLNALFDDVDELIEALRMLKHRAPNTCIYVCTAEGATLGRATLEQETLSDGSHAYNIILHEDDE